MSGQTIACVFARGGSVGVPRKNLRLLGGRPLVGIAVETARASALVDRVIVSTDDEQIAAAAREHGAEVPFMRPAELARSDSPEWLAWQHAVHHLWPDGPGADDALVSVPATAPLRSVEDVDAVIRLLRESDADVVVTMTPSARSPYFNMVTLDEQGRAGLVIKPQRGITRRQDAPVTYDLTTVAYGLRPAFVLRAGGLFEGTMRAVLVPPERALDIDTELDLRIAACLLAARDNREARA